MVLEKTEKCFLGAPPPPPTPTPTHPLLVRVRTRPNYRVVGRRRSTLRGLLSEGPIVVMRTHLLSSHSPKPPL